MIIRIAAVLSFTAVCGAAVEVKIAWDPSLNNINGDLLNETPSYKLFYSETTGVYTQYVNAGTGTQVNVTGLKYDTTYFFAAKAYTETAESAYSAELQWNSPSAPPVLSALTVSGPVTADEGKTAQYVCSGSYSDGSTQTVAAVWSENSPWASISSSGLLTVSNLTADQSLTLTASFGGLSDTHAVTLKDVPPAAPANVRPADQAMNVNRTVTLEWEAVSNASGYEVWFGDSPEAMHKVSTQSAPSYYTGLRRAGRTFWWQITATNEAGSATGGPWSFTTIDEETTEEVLGTVNQEWEGSGAAAWFAQSTITHDGVSAMQSGAITAGQKSVLETTVVGPGTISFCWRVSSEANADFLNFYVNDSLQTGISGAAISGDGWMRESFSIGGGTQRLAWKYEKNGSGTGGADTGWLDEVLWQSDNTATFPLSGFVGKWVAFYLWDHTEQAWTPLGQKFEPDELVLSNIKPERWYWLTVMEYDVKTQSWSLVHGSWINHLDEI
jgi:hypothetical protein